MQPDQIAILTLLGVLLALFATDRLKIEVVALGGLAAGLLLGLVAPASAFDGFASPAVITVVEILLIVGVVARARLFDRLAERLAAGGRHTLPAIAGLLVSATLLSMVMNNIGAMVLMLPVALSLAVRLKLAPARLVMPLAFTTLLGGLMVRT